jgi:hypothetical protein
MATRIIVAALVAALVATTGVSFAQTKSADCPQPSASVGSGSAANAPERIEGQVAKIDKKANMVTLKMPDGSTQQFQANKETIDDLKVGDRIEAKKRTPNC